MAVKVKNRITLKLYMTIKVFSSQNYELDKEFEQLKIYLTGTVGRTNNSVLEIEFNGSLQDKMVGFYMSTYKDAGGKER